MHVDARLGWRTVEPGSCALVFVDGLHGAGAGPAYDGFALVCACAGFGLDVAGRDGEDEIACGIDNLAFAVFGDHVIEVGLGGLELLHLRVEVGVVSFDIGAVGVVDDCFGGDYEGVAQGDLVGLGW